MAMSEQSPREPLAFIVGMGRSGTTWLSASLNCHADVAVIGETAFWGRHFVSPGRDGTVRADGARRAIERILSGSPNVILWQANEAEKNAFRRKMESHVFAEFDPEGQRYTPRDIFLLVCRVITQLEGKREFIEKTPHHLIWYDRIVRAFPKARFIICLRDAYSCMLSYKHQGDRKAGPAQQTFKHLYHPVGYAIVWKSSMKAAMELKQRFPSLCFLVRYEDIENGPGQILERVQAFLGITPNVVPLKPINSSFVTSPKPNLDAADIFWMNLLAGRYIDEYGHSRLRAPFKPLIIFASFLKLPVWALRVIMIRVRDSETNLMKYFLRWLFP